MWNFMSGSLYVCVGCGLLVVNAQMLIHVEDRVGDLLLRLHLALSVHPINEPTSDVTDPLGDHIKSFLPL